MRERAISTIAIWFSLAVSIYLLLERLTYTYIVTTPDANGRPVSTPITEVVPALWQIGIFVLILIMIIGAFGATAFIWDKASKNGDAQQENSAKQKRDQKERVRRLLERMDSDDLASLESRISDDGELVTLEDVLEFQRRR